MPTAPIQSTKILPSISVDCVIFGFDLEKLTVLLIDRGDAGAEYGTRMSLPGDLIYDNENFPKLIASMRKEVLQKHKKNFQKDIFDRRK